MKKLGLIFLLALVGLFGCSSSSVQPTEAAPSTEYLYRAKIISYDVADTHGIIKAYVTINVNGTLQIIDLNKAEGDTLLEESVEDIEGSYLSSNKPFHEILKEGDTYNSRIHYKILKDKTF